MARKSFLSKAIPVGLRGPVLGDAQVPLASADCDAITHQQAPGRLRQVYTYLARATGTTDSNPGSREDNAGGPTGQVFEREDTSGRSEEGGRDPAVGPNRDAENWAGMKPNGGVAGYAYGSKVMRLQVPLQILQHFPNGCPSWSRTGTPGSPLIRPRATGRCRRTYRNGHLWRDKRQIHEMIVGQLH